MIVIIGLLLDEESQTFAKLAPPDKDIMEDDAGDRGVKPSQMMPLALLSTALTVVVAAALTLQPDDGAMLSLVLVSTALPVAIGVTLTLPLLGGVRVKL